MIPNHPKEKTQLLNDSFSVPSTNYMSTSLQGNQLGDLIDTIIESWKLITVIVLLLFFTGLIYVVLARPIYRADVLLQIEENSRGIGMLTELTELMQDESPVNAEFEIIKSRMVIGAVVDNLNLDINAQPNYSSILGALYKRKKERIQVENFKVPSTYIGMHFELEAGEGGSYDFFSPDGKFLMQGKVGELVTVPLVHDEKITLFVSELRGESGTRFTLVKKAWLSALNDLKESIKVTEKGRQSGILQMSMEGLDRGKITIILNEISNIYLRQSVERKSAEAEKTLQFLEKQLPILKNKMENAEAALNNYRLQKGSVDLPMETQSTLEKIVSIDAQLTQFRSDREELIRQFTPEHPRIASLDAQIVNLNRELKKVDTRVKSLPETQQEILRLTRDMEVSSSLYTELMNSAQELKIVKAGAVGNVRIIDYAVTPNKSVKPRRTLVLAASLFFGLSFGVIVAFIRKALQRVVQDPGLIEKNLHLPVYASVPHSRKQRELDRHKKKDAVTKSFVLAAVDTEDLAIESLRSLRTSLYFAKLNAANNITSITSSCPESGKSFISVNLAAVMAAIDKRVLVVDADLRKGRVHQFFGVERELGLSDIIARDIELDKVIHKTKINNLDIISAGTIPPNPSELLLNNKFSTILKVLSTKYNHVIIDTPPVLAVSDSTIISRLAGVTLLVVRDGQSSLQEIEQSMKRLTQAGVNLCGVVYNNIQASGRYGYNKHYQYAYSYSHKK